MSGTDGGDVWVLMLLLFVEVDKKPGSLQAVSAVSWWTLKSDVEGATLLFGKERNIC